jgi:hypothetical protein
MLSFQLSNKCKIFDYSRFLDRLETSCIKEQTQDFSARSYLPLEFNQRLEISCVCPAQRSLDLYCTVGTYGY